MGPLDPELTVRLFLMDTGPLITLAAASSLDYLTLLDLPIYIPDAVMFEATVKDRALGSRDIIDWVQQNADRIRVVPTAALRNHLVLIADDPSRRTPISASARRWRSRPACSSLVSTTFAVLLTEDAGAVKLAQRDEPQGRLVTVTTRDFLGGLEAGGRINSADAVYQAAEDQGRDAAQRTALAQEDARRIEAFTA